MKDDRLNRINERFNQSRNTSLHNGTPHGKKHPGDMVFEIFLTLSPMQVATFKKHGKFVAFEDILNESLWLHTIQAQKLTMSFPHLVLIVTCVTNILKTTLFHVDSCLSRNDQKPGYR
jgi:hypothetical protein